MAYRDFEQVIGRTFGRLKVVGVDRRRGHETRLLCACSCGTEKTIRASDVLSGHIKSCGCKMRVKHGGKGEKLYEVWCSMRRRCVAKSDKRYHAYGGRGITVCDEWSNYETFRDWALKNGYSEGLSIDRVDNDSGYSPSNCRFATSKMQNNNQQKTLRLKVGDVEKTLHEWADFIGMNPNTLYHRVAIHGWNTEKALFSAPLYQRVHSIALAGKEADNA